jgi:phage shock protein PspC (stress-responsive transcriptional regulator)
MNIQQEIFKDYLGIAIASIRAITILLAATAIAPFYIFIIYIASSIYEKVEAIEKND